jgi:glycosyltransferase involved in cell wall biosynthesis
MDHHNAMLWGRVASMAAGVPARVAASHSTGLYGRARSYTPIDRWLMEFTDRVVALSATHAAYLRDVEGIPAGKIRVIENGIDVDAFAPRGGEGEDVRRELGIGPEEAVVIMVAALRPEKAHEALLDAAAALRAQGRRVRVLVVGDGERRGVLEQRVRGERLTHSVHFLGTRHDVARLLHASDVLVLPSHDVVETMPLAVMEAMAAGVPVVASRVGSVPELVEDGRCGRLIAPADGVELGEAVAYILDNPERAREWAGEGQRRVRGRFSLDRMAGRYREMFEELAG